MEQASDIDVIRVKSDLIFTDPNDGRPARSADARDDDGAQAQSAFVRELLAGPASAADREFLANAPDLELGPWEPVVADEPATDGPATSLARCGRAVLVISSRVALPRGQRRRVETSNPSDAFLPDQVVLIDPENWFVHDILIGARSQFRNGGDLPRSPIHHGIPGVAFGPDAIDAWLQLETAQTKMLIAIDVTYVGLEDGGALTCLMLGRAVAVVRDAAPAGDAPAATDQTS